MSAPFEPVADSIPEGCDLDSFFLASIAISLKRIADALEQKAARDNAPIGNLGKPIMPGPHGWEEKS